MNRRNLLNTLLAAAPLSALAETDGSVAPARFVWREVEVRYSVGDRLFAPRLFPVERERHFELEHDRYRAECRVVLIQHGQDPPHWETLWWVCKDGNERFRLTEGSIHEGGAALGEEAQIARGKANAETALGQMLKDA